MGAYAFCFSKSLFPGVGSGMFGRWVVFCLLSVDCVSLDGLLVMFV